MADTFTIIRDDEVVVSSGGVFTAPLFVPYAHFPHEPVRVKPGDVAEFSVAGTQTGYERIATVLPAVSGVEWSLDGVNYSGDDTASAPFTMSLTPVNLWARITALFAENIVMDLTSWESGWTPTTQWVWPSDVDEGFGSDTGTSPSVVVTIPAGTDAGVREDSGVPIIAGSIPAGTDAGVAHDTGDAPSVIVTVAAGTDSGSATDTGTPSVEVSAPSGTDTGAAADSGDAPSVIVTVPSETDAGVGHDTGEPEVVVSWTGIMYLHSNLADPLFPGDNPTLGTVDTPPAGNSVWLWSDDTPGYEVPAMTYAVSYRLNSGDFVSLNSNVSVPSAGVCSASGISITEDVTSFTVRVVCGAVTKDMVFTLGHTIESGKTLALSVKVQSITWEDEELNDLYAVNFVIPDSTLTVS